jgi:hypothetical protein
MASAARNLNTVAEKCVGMKAGVWKNTAAEKYAVKKDIVGVRFTVPRNIVVEEENIAVEKCAEEGEAEAKVKEKNTINTLSK